MTEALYVYDGDCLLCSRFVRFLIKRDPAGRLKLATAQSEAGRTIYLAEGFDPDLMETAILRIGQRTWTHLDLFTEGLAMCGGVWKLARVLHILPRGLADWLYRRIANNRKRFNRSACPMPTPEMRARLID
ncbi:MAG: DCC1-like thiol-disulfide oxidoreductase family protein [Hyphomonadaceae bacterium]|nr:DCC1-like thiol-disulfide oxidoreductase family protein [Hyphomonadaceae bacterium]